MMYLYVLIFLALLIVSILINNSMDMKHRLTKIFLYNYLISGILTFCFSLTILNNNYFNYDNLYYFFFSWKMNFAIAFAMLIMSIIFTIFTYIYILTKIIYKRHHCDNIKKTCKKVD